MDRITPRAPRGMSFQDPNPPNHDHESLHHHHHRRRLRRPRPFRTAIAAAAMLVFAGLALPNSARATLLVYEPFEYAPGGLAGASGGSGWSGNWVTHATPRFQVVTGSLAYPAPHPGLASATTVG
jgi:hypothetical protein